MFQSGPEPVEILGRELRCHVCDNTEFMKREGQLNTAMASAFNLDWANVSGICVICSRCGFIHWFLPIDYLPKS